jgi:hypothetical protein
MHDRARGCTSLPLTTGCCCCASLSPLAEEVVRLQPPRRRRSRLRRGLVAGGARDAGHSFVRCQPAPTRITVAPPRSLYYPFPPIRIKPACEPTPKSPFHPATLAGLSSPRKHANVAWSKGFVRISASCFSVGTWMRSMFPFSTLCFRKWYLTSICLVLECRTGILATVGVLDRQTYQGGTRGSRLCGEDRDRETENSKVCARTRDTKFIQVRVAKVASPTSCLGDQVWRPVLGVGLFRVPS